MTTFALETVPAHHAAVVRADVPAAELPELFGRAFAEVMRVVQAQGLAMTGAPFGYYPSVPGATVEVVAGVPVSAPVTTDGDVTAFELPAGRAVTGVHVGPYDTLHETYRELAEWAAAEGLELAGPMWESYLTDPGEEPDPTRWRTLVTCPVR